MAKTKYFVEDTQGSVNVKKINSTYATASASVPMTTQDRENIEEVARFKMVALDAPGGKQLAQSPWVNVVLPPVEPEAYKITLTTQPYSIQNSEQFSFYNIDVNSIKIKVNLGVVLKAQSHTFKFTNLPVLDGKIWSPLKFLTNPSVDVATFLSMDVSSKTRYPIRSYTDTDNDVVTFLPYLPTNPKFMIDGTYHTVRYISYSKWVSSDTVTFRADQTKMIDGTVRKVGYKTVSNWISNDRVTFPANKAKLLDITVTSIVDYLKYDMLSNDTVIFNPASILDGNFLIMVDYVKIPDIESFNEDTIVFNPAVLIGGTLK